jgi:hypothetical protein
VSNSIEFTEEEVEVDGEVFYLDIEIVIDSYGTPARMGGLPEDSDPGDSPDYHIGDINFNEKMHPILSKMDALINKPSTVAIPSDAPMVEAAKVLASSKLKAANIFCDKNHDKILDKIADHLQDQITESQLDRYEYDND